jgi:hypothetical protein
LHQNHAVVFGFVRQAVSEEKRVAFVVQRNVGWLGAPIGVSYLYFSA